MSDQLPTRDRARDDANTLFRDGVGVGDVILSPDDWAVINRLRYLAHAYADRRLLTPQESADAWNELLPTDPPFPKPEETEGHHAEILAEMADPPDFEGMRMLVDVWLQGDGAKVLLNHLLDAVERLYRERR